MFNTTSLRRRLVLATAAAAALTVRTAPARAQPQPPLANWAEFAQSAAEGLIASDPHNSCNQQPFACSTYMSVCNWIDANSVETLADYAIATGDNLNGYLDYVADEATCWYLNGVGLPNTTPENPWNSVGFGGNVGYNDDALWWASAFIRLYDYYRNSNYLTYAENIFQTVSTWWGVPTPGTDCPSYGIPWRPENVGDGDSAQQENSITNELFLQTATALALRTCQTQAEPWCFLPGTQTKDPNMPNAEYAASGPAGGVQRTFVQWAATEWSWFQPTFMGFSTTYGQPIIYDHVTSPCSVDASSGLYTYNNGVIYGGLTGLAEIEAQWTGHTGGFPETYLTLAYNLASAVTGGQTPLTYTMPNLGPIMVEPNCTLSANCDEGTQIFKGIYLRYLGRLNEWQYLPNANVGNVGYGTPNQYSTFITNNAASAWTGTTERSPQIVSIFGNFCVGGALAVHGTSQES